MPGQVPGGVVAVASNSIDILSYIDPVFQSFVTQYGADMTGFALTEAFASPDGKWEQILENVVLVADSRIDPQSVTLRPLSEKVHIMVEEPRSQGGDPEMYFYPVQENKGYEIPLYFWDYIQKHGGVPVTGVPVTHYSLLAGQVYHQCFTNLCLTYDSVGQSSRRVCDPSRWVMPTGCCITAQPEPDQRLNHQHTGNRARRRARPGALPVARFCLDRGSAQFVRQPDRRLSQPDCPSPRLSRRL